jgi:hypothetical protein
VSKVCYCDGVLLAFAATEKCRSDSMIFVIPPQDALSATLQLGLIRLPELELARERPGGPLPHG